MGLLFRSLSHLGDLFAIGWHPSSFVVRHALTSFPQKLGTSRFEGRANKFCLATSDEVMMSIEASTKIINFITHGAGVPVLGRGHFGLKVKMHYFFDNLLQY